MQGKRVYADINGAIKNLNNGEYGFCKHVSEKTGQQLWIGKTPNGDIFTLKNGSNHIIKENEDKTITVSPSIVTGNWHGWLKNGIWQSV
ncbi:MAG: hypothetical protein OEV78_13085 [Spirochaetia bacterium]|nr:hypothetical protein [Spirochaetia bacterium]